MTPLIKSPQVLNRSSQLSKNARRAGLTEADICVGDFDDQTMVRIYARENATQRTKQVTALDGSVLAAVRWLARQLLTPISDEIVQDEVFESKKAFDVASGILKKGDGVGWTLVSKMFRDMPGMTVHSIKDSLSRLKASGDYARTLLAIIQQIEAEAEAARLEAERLERERLEAEARHFRRFRRHPWGCKNRRKLYKDCTLCPQSCTPSGSKKLYKAACLKPSGPKCAFSLETCRNRNFYILLGPAGRP